MELYRSQSFDNIFSYNEPVEIKFKKCISYLSLEFCENIDIIYDYVYIINTLKFDKNVWEDFNNKLIEGNKKYIVQEDDDDYYFEDEDDNYSVHYQWSCMSRGS